MSIFLLRTSFCSEVVLDLATMCVVDGVFLNTELLSVHILNMVYIPCQVAFNFLCIYC